MNPFRVYILLLISAYILITDGQVTITTESGINSFVCGSPKTLICTTAPSPLSMTWRIGTAQAANCVGTVCESNPIYDSSYIFTFDVENGTFSLKKNTVTLLDNGTTFICQDGSTSDSVTANVIVQDDLGNFESKTTIDNSTKRLEFKVTTGCLNEDTAASVTFQWYFKKVNSADRQILQNGYFGVHIQQVGNNSICISDPDCGDDEFTQKSSLLFITEDEEGDTYTLEVDIDFGNEIRTVNFNTTIAINDLTISTESTTNTSIFSINIEGTTEKVPSSIMALTEVQNTATSFKAVGESTPEISDDIHTTDATVHSANKQEEEILIFIYVLASLVAIGLITGLVFFFCRVYRRKKKLELTS